MISVIVSDVGVGIDVDVYLGKRDFRGNVGVGTGISV